MIPRTYPSEYVTANGKTQMLVYVLTNITGLTRWIDYIPVKGVASENTVVENTYNYNGYMLMKTKDSITGLTPFKEYVPVYEDAAATVPWGTGSNGYIPAYGLFTVQGLFANGEQGWVYDPSNLSTLFQDAAGTTPVTAMEQPVGLQLDTRLGAPTTLGVDVVVNGDFATDTVWSKGTGWSISGGQATFLNATGTSLSQTGLPTMPAGRWYLLEFDMTVVSGSCTVGLNVGGGIDSFGSFSSSGRKRAVVYTTVARSGISITGVGGSSFSIDNISVRELPGNHRYQTTSANRPVVSARVNLLAATNVLSTQSVTTVATTYTLFFSGTGAITLTGTATGVYTAGTYTITCTAGTLIATVAGLVTQADLRVANIGVGLPAYQRVNTSTDYDTAGFPVYIKPNGSNQFMVTNSINFSATDKMTVWQGARKLSDAAQISILSFSNITSSGGFELLAPASPSANNYDFAANGGTTFVQAIAPNYGSPVTNVITGTGNFSASPQLKIRINGAEISTSSGNAGSGPFGNYPAYFYSRGGTGLYFGGNDYGSICRGAASTAGEITSAETWINNRTKAY